MSSAGEDVLSFIAEVVMLWLFLNFTGACYGIVNRPNSCNGPIMRIELLFPGRVVGCWLVRPIK